MTDEQPDEILVPVDSAGARLDVFVAALLPDGSRAEAQRLIEHPIDEGIGVRVNGAPRKPNYRVAAGDRITITKPAARPARPEAQDIAVDIVFQDVDIAVINKPAGLTVHPAPGSPDGTLVNALLHHLPDLAGIGGELRPGIVHRLDKETTGLLVVAKNEPALRSLQRQIQERVARRSYLALVWGAPRFETAEIDAPIGRHPTDRKKMAVTPGGGRAARTDLAVLERYRELAALVEARLHTGRTHQIRVHCAHARHPVMGDQVYGGRPARSAATSKSAADECERRAAALGRQALHAYRLAFSHPRTGEPLEFEAPLPTDFEVILEWLRVSSAEATSEGRS